MSQLTPYNGLSAISGSLSDRIANDVPTIAQFQREVDGLLGRRVFTVAAVAKSNITLIGLAQGLGVVAGVPVLVLGNTNVAENGVYISSTGNWTRHPLFPSGKDIAVATAYLAPSEVYILYGVIGSSFNYKQLGVEKESIVVFYEGLIPDGTRVLYCLPPYQMDYKPSFLGSRAKCSIAPNASTTISLKKNGVEIGQINFAANSKTGVFSAAPAGSLLTTDEFEVTCSAYHAMSGLSISFAMTK